jgi:hypothetical protein
MPDKSRDDVIAQGPAILGGLEAGIMRCDRAWRGDQVALFGHRLAQGGSE